MRKIVLILALLGAALAAAGQALPSGSVLFGQNTWLAPDGSVWTGKDGYGYKKLLGIENAFMEQVPTGSISAYRVVDFDHSNSLAPGVIQFSHNPDSTRAFGNYGVSFGLNSVASGIYSFAQGLNALALGGYSVALAGGRALGSQSVAFGTAALAANNQSIAFNGQTSHGVGAIAFGLGAQAYSAYSLNLGKYPDNPVTTAENDLTAGSPAIIFGNGTSPNNKSNAFIFYNDGKAEFSGTVSGAPAVNNNEFVTLGQVSGGGFTSRTYYVFEGEVDNQHDTTLLEIPLQYEDYWDGTADDEGWGIDFEIKGNFANTSIDNELNLWVGASPANQSNVFKIIIPSGTIPAQYFWMTGTIVKLGPSQVRVYAELKTGDIAGVGLHVLSEDVGIGSGWSLETGAPVRLEVSTNFSSPGSVFVHSARFTQRPINGIYINNL